MVDTTELIETAIGKMGRWQIMFITLIFLSRFSVAWHQLMMVVQHSVPEFHCVNTEISDPCSKECPNYVYDKTYFEKTVVSEWNLVCDDRWITSFIQIMVMFGILIGNVTLGWVADKYGRKNILIIEIAVQIGAGTIAGFVPWLPAFIVLRVISTFATGGMMLTGFVLLMEFVAKIYRVPIGIAFHFPFQLGHASLGLIAYLLPRWDHIQLACSLPNILLLSYICLLPESARWLITMMRVEPVINILEKAAKCNGLPTESIRSNVENFMKQQELLASVPHGRFIDLVLTRKMRLKTFILALNWFVVANLFYGVAELMGKIAGNIFLNVALAGCVQLPGTLICLFMCDLIGNKYSLIIAYATTFIPMFGMLLCPVEPHWPVVLCGCISMMGCSMSFSIIYLYTVELLPTVVRNIGMGVTSMCARIGSMAAPGIMYAHHIGEWIPPLCFGILPIVSAALTFFFLPESHNVELPDTVDQANEM